MSGKNSKGRDYTRLLMIGALMVIVIRYAAAFYASDVGQITGTSSEVTTWFMAISGVGMGFLVVFGQAYTFDGWRRSLPKANQKWTWRFFLLTLVSAMLIVVDVAILVPFTVSRITHLSMDAVLGEGLTWWWSGVVNVAPALLLLGVMLGNQVVATTQISHDAQTNAQTNVREPFVDTKEAKKYSGLENADKYYILNTKSEVAARELGVTVRAIQKWRLKVQEEVKQGRL
jgi:hypothetical protein